MRPILAALQAQSRERQSTPARADPRRRNKNPDRARGRAGAGQSHVAADMVAVAGVMLKKVSIGAEREVKMYLF